MTIDRRIPAHEALALLGWTHRNTLYQKAKAGLIKVVQDQGRNYVMESEIRRYLGQGVDPAPATSATPYEQHRERLKRDFESTHPPHVVAEYQAHMWAPYDDYEE